MQDHQVRAICAALIAAGLLHDDDMSIPEAVRHGIEQASDIVDTFIDRSDHIS